MKTGYYVNGETIPNSRTILEKYLRTQLIYDFITLSILTLNLEIFSFLRIRDVRYLSYLNLVQIIKYK